MEQVQAEQQPESEELDEDEEPAFEQSMYLVFEAYKKCWTFHGLSVFYR